MGDKVINWPTAVDDTQRCTSKHTTSVHAPKYIMNTPLINMPVQMSVRDTLDMAPNGIVLKTLDCSSCSTRVRAMTTMMAASSSTGRDWMMYLPQTQG
jgi:hypothetical protein